MSECTVLCVDDERIIGESIRDYISDDYTCYSYVDPILALEYLQKNRVEILIADYRMPRISGVELLKKAKGYGAYRTGILLTAYADKKLLKQVFNDGLVDVALEKPLDLISLKNEIDALARKIWSHREQEEKLADIYHLLSVGSAHEYDEIIGRNGDMLTQWKLAETAAATDENILITGATGTGKDVFARQIHGLSGRRDKPFIKINCGAIPSTLIESELFGHERGAFSGADRKKYGKIELAHEGTLFLDEIGELPVELQAKLLHVVEDKSFERVGGTESIKVDFRLISATNKDLDVLKEREFRRDLFYRISTVQLKLPDLKSRKNDLPLYITAFMGKNRKLLDSPRLSISREAMDLLCGYSWPGNIRELDNVLKRVIMMRDPDTSVLTAEDFRHSLVEEPGSDGPLPEAVRNLARAMIEGGTSLQEMEEELLSSIVELCGGRVMEASRKTGIPKDRFYRLKGVKNP